VTEGVAVHRHEAALADRGAGLLEREFGRSLFQAQRLGAEADCAGTDDEHLAAGAKDVDRRLDDSVDKADGGRAIVAHDDVGAHFDDDSLRGRNTPPNCTLH
jgi:hypothetical protein